MKALAIKLAGVVVLIVLIVFAIAIFRHGRTSARPESEKKQSAKNIQDRAGEVESQPTEVNDSRYLAYRHEVDTVRGQIEDRYPDAQRNRAAVDLLSKVSARYLNRVPSTGGRQGRPSAATVTTVGNAEPATAASLRPVTIEETRQCPAPVYDDDFASS